MGNDLVLLWLAAFPLMGSPGPATMSLAGMGIAFGVRKGLPYLGGILFGTFAVLVMIATGVTGLILAEPAVVRVLTVLAAAYILYLAWKIATAPILSATDRRAAAPAFSSGLVLAIANPKAFAAIGAVYSGNTLVEGALLLDALAKISALTLVILTVNSAWLAFGSSLSSILSNPRSGRIANVIFACLLILSVAFALLGP
ncbi:LysE family transporter [Algihabitans albus]|uniref:LysE family translocator n=1 Tax=Algihabitans albus TaxID=2164067 RepID=UPI0035D0846D